ncbi:MAG: hypothetical protein APF84_11195 [Gracilibacter sp. BRH_c7a]|nr:MAG: hypothetical protein APF84_11195 [Gracilibacter sp. BRH_c7a]
MLNWKRTGLLLLIVCLMVTMVVGCSAPASQPAAPSEEEVIEPVELKMHFQDPPHGPMGTAFQKWADEVAAKTDGIVKVTLYPSATLGPGPKGIELAQDGISDISWASIGLYAGRFPLTETLIAPMLGFKDGRHASKIGWKLYETSGDVQKEWAETGTKVIGLMSGGETPLGTFKEIKSLDDFKGLKMRSLGGTPTEFTKQIGAVPAVMPPPEMYQQLEKKVLDGWSIDWQAVQGFKLTEITPYIYRFNTSFYHSMHVIVMNEDSYAKIPDKYKETFDSLCGDYFSQLVANVYDDCTEPTIKAAEDSGNTVAFLPEDVEAQMAPIAEQVINDYAKAVDAKGLAGTKTLELIKELLKQNPQ